MGTILEYFSKASEILKKKNGRDMRALNDDILNEAIVNFSPEMYRMATLTYVLSKILSKPRFIQHAYSKFFYEISEALDRGARSKNLLAALDETEKIVEMMDHKDKRFVRSLIDKGKVKMAAVLYAKGMSLGMASQLTGVDKQEILSYAGQTMMFDRVKEEVGLRQRVKAAEGLIE
ncbi:MAG: hypothetical protein QW035_04395 [Candidatus Anstonellales archaeon]